MKAKPGNVIFQCPDCNKQREVPRRPEDHPTAMLCQLQCPDCDDGDFHEGRWFYATGKEVPYDAT
jgi:hypothetical protein